MPPTPDIRSILEEMYQAEPDLRSHESTLTPIVEHLLKLRPDITPDASFKNTLKQKALATHNKLYGQPSRTSSLLHRMLSSLTLKQVAIPVGALALVALIVIKLPNTQTPPSSPTLLQANPSSRLSQLNERAFGSISIANQTVLSRSSSIGNPVPTAMGGDMAEKAVVQDSMIRAPDDITQYKYVYRGELPAWSAKLNVYRRSKDIQQNATLIQSLKQTTQALVNLDSLQNLELQSFTLNQKERYGYTVTVDLLESNVSFQQNYREWPQPYAACKDEGCYQRMRLGTNDVPADAELIRIADGFIKARGISVEGYGSARVNNEWRKNYELAADKSMFYVPDVVTVVYPIVIDDKLAYDEGGFPHGLMVNISIREKRVESVWNLTTNQYQQSAYDAETDQTRIRSFIEKGGIYGYISPQASKTVKIELDTPEIILEKVWIPRETGQPVEELLVPALRFEIKNKPDNIYTPNYVLIPLIKDVLDQQPGGDVRIMY